ncbi:TPA: YSIRK-type signal peptide-containing protein [Streptococcus suis]|nr:YSIRK-type signal peptide-containing protein [Streptococcus suis]HEN0485206.1 YSIRK-type signal peptide-containing protein [Streptococcus suis]
MRKFKRGLASVTVGATLFMAGAAVESFVAPQVVVYAAEETYSANGEWTFTDTIPSDNPNVNPQMTAWATHHIQLLNQLLLNKMVQL